MNKICTDLEQSRKLAEILSLESADMIYPSNFDFPFVWIEKPKKDKNATPCWSLAALLELMPKIHGERPKLDTGRIQAEKYYVEYPYHESTKDDWHSTKLCDSAVDAAFEMVCWLKEHNKL